MACALAVAGVPESVRVEGLGVPRCVSPQAVAVALAQRGLGHPERAARLTLLADGRLRVTLDGGQRRPLASRVLAVDFKECQALERTVVLLLHSWWQLPDAAPPTGPSDSPAPSLATAEPERAGDAPARSPRERPAVPAPERPAPRPAQPPGQSAPPVEALAVSAAPEGRAPGPGEASAARGERSTPPRERLDAPRAMPSPAAEGMPAKASATALKATGAEGAPAPASATDLSMTGSPEVAPAPASATGGSMTGALEDAPAPASATGVSMPGALEGAPATASATGVSTPGALEDAPVPVSATGLKAAGAEGAPVTASATGPSVTGAPESAPPGRLVFAAALRGQGAFDGRFTAAGQLGLDLGQRRGFGAWLDGGVESPRSATLAPGTVTARALFASALLRYAVRVERLSFHTGLGVRLFFLAAQSAGFTSDAATTVFAPAACAQLEGRLQLWRGLFATAQLSGWARLREERLSVPGLGTALTFAPFGLSLGLGLGFEVPDR